MIKLLGKHKTKDWVEVDRANTVEDMDFLEAEYKTQYYGQGWAFKREEEKD
jgi:hypothetical protein